MRIIAAIAGLTVVAACAPKVTLPESAYQRAAYCAGAMTALDAESHFPEATLQYLLLASVSPEGDLDKTAYIAASKTASRKSADISNSQVGREAVAACHAAYPFTDIGKAVVLPTDEHERDFLCHALVDAMGVSLMNGDPPRINMARYSETSRAAFNRINASVRDKVFTSDEANVRVKAALNPALKLGNSYKVIDACRAAYQLPRS